MLCLGEKVAEIAGTWTRTEIALRRDGGTVG